MVDHGVAQIMTEFVNGESVHARVCESTHNQDEQKHVLSQAIARASLARTPQYHELFADACLMVGRCLPQQSNENQMCKLLLYRCALLTCGGSNKGR